MFGKLLLLELIREKKSKLFHCRELGRATSQGVFREFDDRAAIDPTETVAAGELGRRQLDSACDEVSPELSCVFAVHGLIGTPVIFPSRTNS